jgi:hypothetical protein
LKIVVLIIFSFLIAYWPLWIFLFYADSSPYQKRNKKKIIRFLIKSIDGQKILSYIFQKGIKIRVLPWPYPTEWAAKLDFKKPILYFDLKDVSKGNLTPKIKASIAHELGHLEITKENFFIITNFICPFKRGIVSCPFIEYLAWKNGLKILKKLNIEINEKDYFKEADEALKTYLPTCEITSQLKISYETLVNNYCFNLLKRPLKP